MSDDLTILIAREVSEIKAILESEISPLLKRHNDAIYGNGHKGLRSEVDALKTAEEKRSEQEKEKRDGLRSVWVALVVNFAVWIATVGMQVYQRMAK